MKYKDIENIKIEGIDPKDHPDYCDAFIASATYKGVDMNDKQLDEINEDMEFVYQCVQDYLF